MSEWTGWKEKIRVCCTSVETNGVCKHALATKTSQRWSWMLNSAPLLFKAVGFGKERESCRTAQRAILTNSPPSLILPFLLLACTCSFSLDFSAIFFERNSHTENGMPS